MSHNVEYLRVSFFLYWNSHNQHTVNLQICTTFHQLASLALSGFIFVASWLLTEAHGKENHSPMVPSKTRRADHLPLRPTVLPCLMFWKFMELEICQEEPRILQFLRWPVSPPAVLNYFTVSCPSQISSCCPLGPGRWGKCFLVPSPYCREPNAGRLLQWHTDNITGELGTFTSPWTLIQWFTVKV